MIVDQCLDWQISVAFASWASQVNVYIYSLLPVKCPSLYALDPPGYHKLSRPFTPVISVCLSGRFMLLRRFIVLVAITRPLSNTSD
jgi:hypothetical protein